MFPLGNVRLVTYELNASLKIAHHYLNCGLLCYINKPVSYIVQRNCDGRVVVLRAGLFLTGGAELQDGGGTVRAGGLASNVQKQATAPAKRSGIAEGPWGQRQSFYSSFDLFSLNCLPWSTWPDLHFTTFIQFK